MCNVVPIFRPEVVKEGVHPELQSLFLKSLQKVGSLKAVKWQPLKKSFV